MWNDQILRCPENVNHDGHFLNFCFKFFALSEVPFRDGFDAKKQRKMILEYREIRR